MERVASAQIGALPADQLAAVRAQRYGITYAVVLPDGAVSDALNHARKVPSEVVEAAEAVCVGALIQRKPDVECDTDLGNGRVAPPSRRARSILTIGAELHEEKGDGTKDGGKGHNGGRAGHEPYSDRSREHDDHDHHA